MKFKTILLATVGLAAMTAPVFAQNTDAAPAKVKHRHHRHVVAAHGTVADRIDELERQIQELKAEQHAQAQAQMQAAQTNTDSSASQDTVSQAQFEALQNQVYEEQAATTSSSKNGWWNNTKVGGRIYYDISNVDARGNIKVPGGSTFHTDSPQDGLNYDLKRFYLIVDHNFDDTFAANLTTDVTYDSSTGASQLFIKKAYLQAKVDPGLIFRIGATDLPWVPFVEGIYGYRYVENTLIDRTKFGTSTDWGAHVMGTLFDGLLSYQGSAINGFGYKAAPIGGGVNRSKGIDLEGRVNLNWNGFVAAIGGYDGKLGKDVEDAQVKCGTTIVHFSQTCHTASRFDALVAYTNDDLRVGAEYFSAQDYKSVTSVAGAKADGYSAFASYQFMPKWGVFGRYDWVTPTDARIFLGASKARNEYYNFGISYSPIKQLDFALVYKHDSMQNGAFSDSEFSTFNCLNRTTKPYSVVGTCNQGTYNEIGLFGQVNF